MWSGFYLAFPSFLPVFHRPFSRHTVLPTLLEIFFLITSWVLESSDLQAEQPRLQHALISSLRPAPESLLPYCWLSLSHGKPVSASSLNLATATLHPFGPEIPHSFPLASHCLTFPKLLTVSAAATTLYLWFLMYLKEPCIWLWLHISSVVLSSLSPFLRILEALNTVGQCHSPLLDTILSLNGPWSQVPQSNSTRKYSITWPCL